MNLKFSYLFFLLLVGLSFGFTSESNFYQPDDTIYIDWRDRKLTWDDFRGPIPSDSKFHALTHSAINMEFQGEDHTLEFSITTIFDPNKSWKKKGVNAYVLKHEQIHFDITEYHSRLLRKKLKTYRYTSPNSIENEVRKMFDESFELANKMQIKYDHETNHSLNKKKQSKWNKKIKKLLQKTSSYKNPKIKVNVGYLFK